jgi:hypothetical protein
MCFFVALLSMAACIHPVRISLNNSCSNTESNDIIIDEEALCILRDADILYINDKRQSTAFFVCIKSENAVDIFIEIFEKSKTGVGRFYALLGLFEIEKNKYREKLLFVDPLEKVGVKSIRSSDVIHSNTLKQLIETIESGRWMEFSFQELEVST